MGPPTTPAETIATPIGWYVHLPFCTTKCGYCDFYSLPTRPEMIPDLVTALRREMDLRDPGRPVASVFVGGGTPTVLPVKALAAILDLLDRRIARAGTGDVEFTCEANPSSADELKLDLLRSRGVNRISFGAQSFNPDELRVLERLHDPVHIAEAVALARAAGFDNVNLDLIYGVPGQTMASWLDSLRRAVDLGPDHLSCYALMYEPGTALLGRMRAGRVKPCDEDLEAEMFLRTIDVLAEAGYEQYEISNFARPGRRCRHNMIYWRNEEYLGIGPSAVTYLDGVRRKNAADVRAYVTALTDPQADANAITVESERLDAPARARETAIQMLRLVEGIDVPRFRRTTGADPLRFFADAIDANRRRGLLVADDRSIRLTRKGQLLSNRVMTDFL